MTVQEIDQEIRIIMMRLNVEDDHERTQQLEKALKKLNYQKEIQVIRDKITQLDK